MRIHCSTFHICSNIIVIIKICKTKKVGNPFVFHTLVFDKSTGNDDGRTGNNRDRSEGDLVGEEEFLMEEEGEFLMYYSAGSTHLADSNIDEPLYLGLGQ